MREKFNPKKYLGRNRVEKSVPGNPNITKLWHWNPDKETYEVKPDSRPYVARRKRIVDSKTVTQKATFRSLETARLWQHEAETKPLSRSTDSPSFTYVVDQYVQNRFPALRVSTQALYSRLIESKNWEFLKQFNVNQITAIVIDDWIRHMKSNPQRITRIDFGKDLALLKTILTYYAEYDDNYQLPFKPRHKKDIIVKARTGTKNRDLTEAQFQRFREALLKGKHGVLYSTLATIQFHQALRISEAAGIHDEDIELKKEKHLSRLRITKSVMYDSKKRGIIQDSFKNSRSNHGVKEGPLFPESYYAIQKFFETYKDRKGALFVQDNGELLTYRQIQHAYDKAFKDAGLDYSGTHIMRHGGARATYDSSNGDFGVATQLLGNSDIKSVQVYAKRSTAALNQHSEKVWKKHLDENEEPIPQLSTEVEK